MKIIENCKLVLNDTAIGLLAKGELIDGKYGQNARFEIYLPKFHKVVKQLHNCNCEFCDLKNFNGFIRKFKFQLIDFEDNLIKDNVWLLVRNRWVTSNDSIFILDNVSF